MYTHTLFLCFHYVPEEFHEQRQQRWKWALFMIKNFCLLFREDSQRRSLVIGADEVDHGSSSWEVNLIVLILENTSAQKYPKYIVSSGQMN